MASLAASGLMGGAVGLISIAMFALILRRIQSNDPGKAVSEFRTLIVIALGGGLLDYTIFDVIIQAKGIVYYMLGFASIFLSLGLLIFIDWLRQR